MTTFTATVANTGNVIAESVNVTVNWPSKSNLVDLSEHELKNNDSLKQSSKIDKSQGQPTKAKKQKSDDQSGGQSSGDQMKMKSKSFVIDRLEPGQTAEFTYTIRSDNTRPFTWLRPSSMRRRQASESAWSLLLIKSSPS